MASEVKNLNKEQEEAVNFNKGPLLIIAGAGTGKTTVITEKIKNLIQKDLAKPSEILALTFTEKAAQEMQERVDIAMPYGYTQMWISTFHSFCDRILKSDGLEIGLNPRYKLSTEAESIQFIRNNLFKFDLDYFRPLGNPTKFISGMLQHFSRLQDEDVSPDDYINWAKSKSEKIDPKGDEDEKLEIKKWLELSNAYKKYDELKAKEGMLDFGDLIIKTIVLFRKRPNILKKYQNLFKYILVDEFQDTNYSQNELAILLSGKNENITVCGDDDQSIYRFRGAAVSNIIQFRKNFPMAKIVVLTRNYRSSQEILDRAYDLVQFNNPDRLEVVEKIDKKLIANKKTKGEEITLIHKDRVENEADEVARVIEKLTTEKKHSTYSYKDFAILVRANNHADPFVRALGRHGIPHQFLGPGRLFKQEEIIDLVSYLKVLNNFDDSVALFRLISMEHFDIPARDLAALGNYSRKFNLSLYETCEKVDDVFVKDETREKIKNITEIINKHLDLIRKETAGQILYYFLESTGLLRKLLSPDNPMVEKKTANISKFFDKLKTYEVNHEDATVPAVVDWIELSSELGESPLAADSDWGDINAVNILTVHSAKGLEFPVVFLVNLVSQRFPTMERREQIPIPDELIKEVLPEGDYHLEEERRLFYVGMTRAKDLLYFTAANFYGEAKRDKKLSPYIFEALGDKAISGERKEQTEQLSFLDYSSSEAAGKEDKSQQPTTKFHVDYLSYSQIETFKICPLHYKLKYIYKVPTAPTSSQSFGNSFHLTMKAFFEGLAKEEKPSDEMIYQKLRENWISEGYLSKSHEKGSFDKAKRFLKYFLENFYDRKVQPIALENPFLIRLNNLRVGGKIDRVDLKGDTLHIIDYKTGATPLTQKEADRDLQLSIYGLAATQIPEYPFNRSPEKVKLSLLYFDTPQIVTTVRSKEQLEEAKKIIEDYKKQIEESEFECSGNMLCKSCEYSLMCRTEV